MPEMDDDQGTSVVMIHSDKGLELWNQVKSQLNYREAERDKALSPNADSRKSVEPHINRKKFFKKLNKNASIDELERCIEVSFTDKIRRKGRHMYHSKCKLFTNCTFR